MTSKRREPETAQALVKIPCEIYSRIVGYLRPVQNWHQGKRQEFRERKMFRVPEEVALEEESR